ESRLAGLGEWARVRDWRVGQIQKLPNVSVYRESEVSAEQALEMGAQHIVVATGARWRVDGFGRHNHKAIPVHPGDTLVLGADDALDDKPVEGPVLVFDDDDYYLGGVVAETLRKRGLEVTLATPSPLVSAWTVATLEQEKIQRRLLEIGVRVACNQNLA